MRLQLEHLRVKRKKCKKSSDPGRAIKSRLAPSKQGDSDKRHTFTDYNPKTSLLLTSPLCLAGWTRVWFVCERPQEGRATTQTRARMLVVRRVLCLGTWSCVFLVWKSNPNPPQGQQIPERNENPVATSEVCGALRVKRKKVKKITLLGSTGTLREAPVKQGCSYQLPLFH